LYLQVTKEVALSKASEAASSSGEAAKVIQTTTADLAAVAAKKAKEAAEQAGPYVDQAKSKAVESSPFLLSESAAPARPVEGSSRLVVLVPVALLVAAGLAWRKRAGAAYHAAKAEGGEPAQAMI
jgi:hypothetical protein